MPARRGLRTCPRLYVAADGCWPDGPLTDDAPREALLAQDIAIRFREAVAARNLKKAAAARKAGISRKTAINILRGDTWLDLPTIDRIERNFGLHLWNRNHWPQHDQR